MEEHLEYFNGYCKSLSRTDKGGKTSQSAFVVTSSDWHIAIDVYDNNDKDPLGAYMKYKEVKQLNQYCTEHGLQYSISAWKYSIHITVTKAD